MYSTEIQEVLESKDVLRLKKTYFKLLKDYKDLLLIEDVKFMEEELKKDCDHNDIFDFIFKPCYVIKNEKNFYVLSEESVKGSELLLDVISQVYINLHVLGVHIWGNDFSILNKYK